MSKGRKREKSGHIRDLLLAILRKNDCIMYRAELLQELINRIAPEVGKKARKKAKRCLDDAERDGIIVIEGDIVVLPRCIHMKEVVEGLDILLYTLNYVETSLPIHIPRNVVESYDKIGSWTSIYRCHEYVDYLNSKGINVVSIEGVERHLKMALEHLITSEQSVKELLRYVISREDEDYKVLDLTDQKVVEFIKLLDELRDKVRMWGGTIGGCCRECVKLKLCSETAMDSGVKAVEVFIKMLLSAVCTFQFQIR
jgi:hypothetical protein